MGHVTAADAYLAASAAARAREERQAAREALAIGALDHHTTNREAAWESIAARVTGDPATDDGMERLMTADEVAAVLGVHRKFVYARHHSGALRGYKLGPHYRFRRADVRRSWRRAWRRRTHPTAAKRGRASGGAGGKLPGAAGWEGGVSVRQVRRGVYQVRWREAGRGSPAHSVMVFGTTDGEARRRADTVDAEIRNRKAAGERVISVARRIVLSR